MLDKCSASRARAWEMLKFSQKISGRPAEDLTRGHVLPAQLPEEHAPLLRGAAAPPARQRPLPLPLPEHQPHEGSAAHSEQLLWVKHG